MEILNLLSKYWTLIIALIGITVSYTKLKTQNDEQEKAIVHLQSKVESLCNSQSVIDVKLAEILLDLKWIKQSLKNDKR